MSAVPAAVKEASSSNDVASASTTAPREEAFLDSSFWRMSLPNIDIPELTKHLECIRSSYRHVPLPSIDLPDVVAPRTAVVAKVVEEVHSATPARTANEETFNDSLFWRNPLPSIDIPELAATAVKEVTKPASIPPATVVPKEQSFNAPLVPRIDILEVPKSKNVPAAPIVTVTLPAVRSPKEEQTIHWLPVPSVAAVAEMNESFSDLLFWKVPVPNIDLPENSKAVEEKATVAAAPVVLSKKEEELFSDSLFWKVPLPSIDLPEVTSVAPKASVAAAPVVVAKDIGQELYSDSQFWKVPLPSIDLPEVISVTVAAAAETTVACKKLTIEQPSYSDNLFWKPSFLNIDIETVVPSAKEEIKTPSFASIDIEPVPTTTSFKASVPSSSSPPKPMPFPDIDLPTSVPSHLIKTDISDNVINHINHLFQTTPSTPTTATTAKGSTVGDSSDDEPSTLLSVDHAHFAARLAPAAEPIPTHEARRIAELEDRIRRLEKALETVLSEDRIDERIKKEAENEAFLWRTMLWSGDPTPYTLLVFLEFLFTLPFPIS
ncbi:hypothetical protein BC829DRAFT_492975 [Chytridium lagenaria]|nr:hypothetical protein BC829DRAFT_492975 [Chytridium lagenaria]